MPIREKDGKIHYREPKRTFDTQDGGALTLEIRTVQKLWVFPYAHFLNSCLNPSGNLEITFVSYRITIAGRNLHILHQALTSMSLKMIEPTSSFSGLMEEQDVQIECVNVVPVTAMENFDTEEQ